MSHDPSLFKRNDGTCNGGILPQYWGLGNESRGTPSKLPEPFAVEVGNPKDILEGWQEKWFYILDSTDRVTINGSQIIHDCQAMYIIPENNSGDPFHVQKANIPMDKGSYLIYGTAHMHSGVVNATLYAQDGRELCTSTPTYGTGKEAGNEEGYAVGMSVCYPKPGSIKINDGEIVTIESRYKNEFLTGAMGHMYIYLADRLQHTT
ncbi:uncharacterized protein [Cicer arietinum]|uniref:uncharacterized protein n=1 Tax=Cicer arietinum TaxID=3827 RepID=UPI003CC53479